MHLQTFATVKEWTGTATELLEQLTAHAFKDKRPPKGWPAASNALSGALKRIAPALLGQGVEVELLNRDGKSRAKQWRVSAVEQKDRSHRSDHSEGVKKDVQDGVNTANDNANDAHTANDETVRTHAPSFAQKGRAGQVMNDANDANDKKPYRATNGERGTSSRRGGEDL